MNRIDAYEKVTGRAVYADDIKLDPMLYAKQLYAEYPHAKILKIDTSAALGLEGVACVVTSKDCPGLKRVGGIVKDYYVLAEGKTRYHGDVVAAVAARDYETACRAASLIKVEYEPLEPILDPVKAMQPSSPKVHDEMPNNIVKHFKVRHNDTEKEFAKAKKIFEAEFQTQFVEHSYMEPESCVAIPNGDGSITILGGMQHPFSTRRYVAWFMGLPLNKVQIKQTTLGGGFGGKDDTISVICARAALLARKSGRPVKLTLTREDSIRESYKRHPFNVRLKMSVGADNKIRALESQIIADGGPYCATSPFVIWRPTVQCTGPYLVPNVKCDSYAVYTNNPLCGAMRGFGAPQYNFCTESFMDIVAHELNISPVKFRELNFFKQNDVTHTGQKLSNHKVSISQVVSETLAKFGWDAKYKRCSRGKAKGEKFYGIGMACSYRGVSLGAEGNDMCSAIINIQPDGSVLLEVGVAENGQGLKTAMTTILCGELGIDASCVIYLDVDTNSIPDSAPTVASRGTLVGGNAVIDACKQLKELMSPVLTKLLGASKGSACHSRPRLKHSGVNSSGNPPKQVDYKFDNGFISNPKTGKKANFGEVIEACHKNRIYLHALGEWQGPRVHWDEENGQGDAYFTYVYGCNAVELEVDKATGKIKVISCVGAHDVGKAINPQMLEGQIYGGMVMGMGQALTEEVVCKDGKIENLNFNKYKILRATDVPDDMAALLIENADPAGPWGAKSIGEPVNELMAGAIGNAVFNATGVRVCELPIKRGL